MEPGPGDREQPRRSNACRSQSTWVDFGAAPMHARTAQSLELDSMEEATLRLCRRFAFVGLRVRLYPNDLAFYQA